MKRRAKIIATLGPASNDKDTIKKLLRAGMDVARINFSHGDHKDHSRVIKLLRESAEELKQPVTILQDLSGPKIRTGQLEEGSALLEEGTRFILTTDQIPGNRDQVSVSYRDLPSSVALGGRILLDDGRLELSVTGVKGNKVITKVIQG